jgi:Tol biopolymer transport system component
MLVASRFRFAFAAPAPDGYYQTFRIAIAGGAAVQATFDSSHNTQPAWFPDGERIAFTVWNYDATFWAFTTR